MISYDTKKIKKAQIALRNQAKTIIGFKKDLCRHEVKPESPGQRKGSVLTTNPPEADRCNSTKTSSRRKEKTQAKRNSEEKCIKIFI